jgi:hypothetical protein
MPELNWCGQPIREGEGYGGRPENIPKTWGKKPAQPAAKQHQHFSVIEEEDLAEVFSHRTTGSENTANGSFALLSNTTGYRNTANGVAALERDTTGFENTANGVTALFSNTTGFYSAATGFEALYSNTTGELNNAFGFEALYSNSTGHRNTGISYQALYSNTTGYRNTAVGGVALFNSTTGNFNTAYGWSSLGSSTTGNFNIAMGPAAGQNIVTGSNNIAIGSPGGAAAESNTIRIGVIAPFTDLIGQVQPVHTATYIAGIYGTAMPGGSGVVIDANGRLGVKPSSVRFKDEIKPMDKASEAILVLKPVTFRYKKELDAERTPQFGLVAEDVEKVSPDLVVRDAEGKVYTVLYEAVNAMLLNEFLKEHRKNEKQEATITELKTQIATLAATVKEQASQIQKVSAQLELSKPAPQTVLNH